MLRGLLTRKGRTWRWSRNLSRKPGGSWPDVVPSCVFCFLPAGPFPPCSLHFILYSQALFLFNSFSLIGLLREWCIMVATLLQSIPYLQVYFVPVVSILLLSPFNEFSFKLLQFSVLKVPLVLFYIFYFFVETVFLLTLSIYSFVSGMFVIVQ